MDPTFTVLLFFLLEKLYSGWIFSVLFWGISWGTELFLLLMFIFWLLFCQIVLKWFGFGISGINFISGSCTSSPILDFFSRIGSSGLKLLCFYYGFWVFCNLLHFWWGGVWFWFGAIETRPLRLKDSMNSFKFNLPLSFHSTFWGLQ